MSTKGDKKMYQPKEYFYKNRTFKWGEDLTPLQIRALKKGEVFVLLGKNGKPHSRILMDSYNQIRERHVECQCKLDVAIKGLTI